MRVDGVVDVGAVLVRLRAISVRARALAPRVYKRSKKSTKAMLGAPRLGAYCQEIMDSKCIGKLNGVLMQVAGKLVEFALSVACV